MSVRAALFNSDLKPSDQTFNNLRSALEKLNRLENGDVNLGGYTFIAPSDNALQNLADSQDTTVDELLEDRADFLQDVSVGD